MYQREFADNAEKAYTKRMRGIGPYGAKTIRKTHCYTQKIHLIIKEPLRTRRVY